MVELPAELEQQLRDLPETEWSALQARLRPPDTSEAFRTAAARHIPEAQLDAFMAIADPSKFVGANGEIDQARLGEHLSRAFGTGDAQPPQSPQWGQHSAGGGPGKRAGDDGRSALQTRHGVKNDAPQFDQGMRRGDTGRAALERRHGAGGGKR